MTFFKFIFCKNKYLIIIIIFFYYLIIYSFFLESEREDLLLLKIIDKEKRYCREKVCENSTKRSPSGTIITLAHKMFFIKHNLNCTKSILMCLFIIH